MNNNEYLPEGYLFGSNKNREYTSSLSGLIKAAADNAIVEAMAVMCDGSMNLYVDVGGTRIVIPHDETQYHRCEEGAKDIAILTRVGKPVCFRVFYDGADIRLSRRRAQEECAKNYIGNLIPGDIIPAFITHLESFGAFADIGCGIISLLPVDCISVSRISHPNDRILPRTRIYAVVANHDTETGRITLSTRELLGTWEENAALFSPGETVTGIVRSIETYGVFIELTPNLAGLAELGTQPDSMFSIGRNVHLPSRSPDGNPDSPIGQSVTVYIKSIIPERMKIKLAPVDLFRNNKSVPPLKYFIDCEKVRHIDVWKYSPVNSRKTVETDFRSARDRTGI